MAISTRKTVYSSLAALALSFGAAAALSPALADSEGNRANKPGPAAYQQITPDTAGIGLFGGGCMVTRPVFDSRGNAVGSKTVNVC